MTPSLEQYHRLLKQHPQLGAAGLSEAAGTSGDFARERAALHEAYAPFGHCCTWLLDCTPMARVSCVAPSASALRTCIEQEVGQPIPLGAVIAAVFYLRLPWHRPEGSHDIRVGISVRSPALLAQNRVLA